MSKGRLLVIEGTDCSGKETQSKKLVEYINNNGGKAVYVSFPMYDTPTGRIVGGPFLGKKEISEGFFPEKAPSVEAKVASLYYAADRKYNVSKITDALDMGYDVILDRYVESSMAYQGGKMDSVADRREMYYFLQTLEYDLLQLPKPDKVILLYMPVEYSKILKQNRASIDQNEIDEEYLKKSERTYLELAELFNFDKIDCVEDNQLLKIEDIHQKVINSYESLKESKIKR